jgi:hypothetical protein
MILRESRKRRGRARDPVFGLLVAVVVSALALIGARPAGAQVVMPQSLLQTAQTTAPQQGPTAPATTQPPAPAPEEKGPNTGRISLTAGIDYTTDYYFRGILQEDHDYILQPYGELTIKLYESKDALSSVFFTIGSWNSLNGGPSGIEGGSASHDPKIWYESDFYSKLGVTLFDDLTVAAVYTAYMSPNDRFKTVQELALSVAYNDAKLLGPFALNPSALLAFEMKGQADAGRHRGIYLQLGIAPGLTLFEEGPVTVALSFPLTLGLSVKDYYEFGTGDDDTFGYFSGGIAASVPLKFIPAAFGSWQAKTSVTFLALGDNLERINNGDSFEVIGTFGIALTY